MFRFKYTSTEVEPSAEILAETVLSSSTVNPLYDDISYAASASYFPVRVFVSSGVSEYEP